MSVRGQFSAGWLSKLGTTAVLNIMLLITKLYKMNNEFKQASWDGCKFFLCTQTDFEKPGSWLQVIKQIQNI